MALKIYINTIRNDEYANAVEAAEKAIADVKEGEPSKELKDAKAFAESLSSPNIKDVIFTVGEWKHVDEKVITADDLKKYPNIKEAHIVLEERVAQALEEKCLGPFASALTEAATQYEQDVPAIADTVKKLIPAKEVIG